jgi:hypothetical protein
VNIKAIVLIILMLGLTACQGLDRGVSSFTASSFGANWIVVQYRFDGEPMNCWKLTDAAIENEAASDGIYWKDPSSGNLVHISGWYNRVQVTDKIVTETRKARGLEVGPTKTERHEPEFEQAARLVGVDASLCGNGIYPTK